jgi:hypothetical protein
MWKIDPVFIYKWLYWLWSSGLGPVLNPLRFYKNWFQALISKNLFLKKLDVGV